MTIGVLAALDKTDLLDIQFDSALERDELTVDQLREVVVHLTHYIGWPHVHRGEPDRRERHRTSGQGRRRGRPELVPVEAPAPRARPEAHRGRGRRSGRPGHRLRPARRAQRVRHAHVPRGDGRAADRRHRRRPSARWCSPAAAAPSRRARTWPRWPPSRPARPSRVPARASWACSTVLCDLSVPLLAAVNGVAVGLGFTLLAHCDLVVVAEDARLRVPFAELGVPAEAASSYLFPAAMGWQQAARILLTSDWVSADELVALGLALHTSAPDAVLDETVALAARVAAHPRAATRAITFADAGGASRRHARGQPPGAGCVRPVARRRRGAGRLGRLRRQEPLDHATRHHRRPHRSRRRAGGARRPGRGAGLRLGLGARAHPSARPRGHPAGPRRRRAPRRLQALPRPPRRVGDRRRLSPPASGSAPASCWPRSTTPSSWPSRWPRSTISRGDASTLGVGFGWNRAEAEDHGVESSRGATTSSASTCGPWRPSGRTSRPSSTASSSTSSPRGPGPSPSSSRACAR